MKNRKLSPFLRCNLNGLPIFGLIDSGNTSYNAINEKVAQRLWGKDFMQQLNRVDQVISTAKQGEHLTVLGRVKNNMQLQIGPNVFMTKPLVIRGLASAFNISLPFMCDNNIDQIHSKNVLKIGKQVVPLSSYQQIKQGIHATTVKPRPRQQNPVGKTRCYLACDYRLLPNTVNTVALRVTDRPSIEEQGILHTAEEFLEKTRTNPPLRSLHVLKDNGVLFCDVMNTSDQRITLPRGMLFGEYISLSREDFEDMSNNEYISQMTTTTKSPIDREWIIEKFKLRESEILKGDRKLFHKTIGLLMRFSHIISREDEYGRTELTTHHINLEPSAKPIKSRCRPINPIMETSLKEQIDHWLNTGSY